MQNQTLPIQLSPTAIAPPASRVDSRPNSDGPAFSQTLNREMAQRQKMAPTPPVAIKTPDASATPKNQLTQASKPTPPAQPGTRAEKHLANVDNAAADASDAAGADPAAAAAAAAAPGTTPAVDAAAASADAAAASADAAAAAAAAAPMTDMLALVASYKQLLQGGPARTTAAPTDTAVSADAGTSVRTTGIAADTQTLAALQGALKKSDGADTGTGTGKQVTAQDDDAAPAAKPRTAPDLAATVATKTSPADAALATARDAVATAPLKDTAPVTGSAFQAQLTAAETVQTAVTPASDRIPARLGTTAWDNQVSQKVVWMVGGADQTASLTLNPPDLGPVQVVLNVNNDQATVAFSSATPEVREALENAMPRLREMLSDAGVTLGEASVSANMPDQRQADTNQGGDERNGRNNGGGNANGVRSGEAEIAVPRTASRAIRDDGGLDTFA